MCLMKLLKENLGLSEFSTWLKACFIIKFLNFYKNTIQELVVIIAKVINYEAGVTYSLFQRTKL